MKFLKLSIKVFLIFVAVLLLVVSLFFVYSGSSHAERIIKRMIEERASKIPGCSLSIGELRFSPYRLKLITRDVKFSFKGGRVSIEDGYIAEVRLRFPFSSFSGLAGGNLRLREVLLKSPSMKIVLAKEGALASKDLPSLSDLGSVRVEKLAIRSGNLSVEERSFPIDLALEKIEVDYHKKIFTSEGLLQCQFRADRIGDIKGKTGILSMRFNKSEESLRISKCLVSGDWGEVKAQGFFAHKRGIEFDLTISSRFDLETFSDLTKASLKPVGQLRTDGSLRGSFKEFQFQGTLSSESISVSGIHGETLRAKLIVTKDRLTVRDLTCSLLGGEIAMNLEGNLPLKGQVYSMSGEARSIDLEKLRALLHQEGIPVKGYLSGKADIRFVPVPGKLIGGNVTINLRKKESRILPRELNIEGEIVTSIVDGEIRVEKGSVRTDASQAEFKGTIFPQEKSRIQFIILSNEIQELSSLASNFPSVQRIGAQWSKSIGSLKGKCSLSGSLNISGPFTAAAECDCSNLSLMGSDLGAAKGSFEISGESLKVISFSANGSEGKADVRAFLNLRNRSDYWIEGQVSEVPLQFLLRIAGKEELPLTSRISLRGSVRSINGIPYGNLYANSSQGILFGQQFESFSADLRLEGERIRLESMDIQALGGSFIAHGEYHLPESALHVEMRGERFEISQLSALKSKGIDLRGELELTGDLTLQAGKLRGEGRISSNELSYKGSGIGPVVFEADFDYPVVMFKAAMEGWNSHLSGVLRLEKDFPFEGDLEVERIDLTKAGRFIGIGAALDASGFLSAIASFSGSLKHPEDLKISAEVKEFELRAGGNVYRNVSTLPIKYNSGEISAESISLTGKDTDITISALIDIPKDRLKLKIKGDFDLSILGAFAKDISAGGEGHLEVYSEGKFRNPDLKGTIRVTNGRIRHFSLPYPIEGLSVEAEFNRDFVNFNSIACEFGGGEVRGSGTASIEKLTYDIYGFEFDVKGVSLNIPSGLKYTCDGSLLLRGDRSSAIISGSINIIRGLYFKDFGFGSQLIVNKGREYQPFESRKLPESVFLDLDVEAPEGLWIKNDMADAELEGHLHIGGDLNRMEVTGRLSALEGGIIKYGDVNFEITEGYINFANIARINPSLDILAETVVSDYMITVKILGDLENIQLQFSSSPSLPEQDIIALLLTGTTIESLYQQGSTALAEDLAKGYFAGRVSGKITKQLQQKLGFEKIEIDPLLVENQTDPTARITFGKKLSNSIMIIYSTYLGGTEENIYQLNYQVLKNFMLIAERMDTGAFGTDLRYRKHLKWKSGKASGAELRTRAIKVKDVRIDGDCPINTKRFLRKIGIKKGKEFKRSLVFEGSEKLKELLIRDGFLKAFVDYTVDQPEEDACTVSYAVKCGQKVIIVFHGASRSDEKKLRKKLVEIAKESVFPQELINEIEKMIRDFYLEDGYYAADISSRNRMLGGQEEITFDIDAGEQVRVDKIVITGNKSFNVEKIKRQMLVKEDSAFAKGILRPSVLNDDLLAIKNLYMENGFANVRIGNPEILVSSNGKRATILINIEEGDVVKLEAVIFEGNTLIPSDKLLQVISSKEGNSLISSSVMNDRLSLRRYYDSEGFSDAKITTDIVVSGATAHLTFKINEGAKKKIGDILITGNRLTKEKVIRSKLMFRSGENLSNEKILLSQQRLYSLGIFKNISITHTPSENASIDNVKVQIEEADNLHLSVGGGYDNISGPRGFFEIADANFLGRDRFASFLVRGSQKDSRIQFLFRRPKFFGSEEQKGPRRNIDTIFSTYWERQEQESFTVRRFDDSIQIARKLSPVWTRYFLYNFQNVKILDLKISLEEFKKEEPKLESTRLSSIGLSFIRDTRNDPFQPQSGMMLISDGRVFARMIGSEVDFARLFFQGSYFKDIGKKIIFASYVRAGFAKGLRNTDVIPLSERFFAGGPYSVRGFERDEVGPKDPVTGNPLGGESIFLLNEELHIPIYGKLKGVVFYDAGNVYFTLADTDLADLRHVLGAGFRLETPIGPLRFEYGRKLDRKDGESSGEFFISIGSLF